MTEWKYLTCQIWSQGPAGWTRQSETHLGWWTWALPRGGQVPAVGEELCRTTKINHLDMHRNEAVLKQAHTWDSCLVQFLKCHPEPINQDHSGHILKMLPRCSDVLPALTITVTTKLPDIHTQTPSAFEAPRPQIPPLPTGPSSPLAPPHLSKTLSTSYLTPPPPIAPPIPETLSSTLFP